MAPETPCSTGEQCETMAHRALSPRNSAAMRKRALMCRAPEFAAQRRVSLVVAVRKDALMNNPLTGNPVNAPPLFNVQHATSITRLQPATHVQRTTPCYNVSPVGAPAGRGMLWTRSM